MYKELSKLLDVTFLLHMMHIVLSGLMPSPNAFEQDKVLCSPSFCVSIPQVLITAIGRYGKKLSFHESHNKWNELMPTMSFKPQLLRHIDTYLVS